MDILIIYSTKNGVTGECAAMLADKLKERHNVTLASVNEGKLPAPKDFDIVFLGSSIRMGAVNKELKRYIRDNMSALKAKHCGVFLCCGFADNFDEYCDIQLLRELSPDMGFHYFGGELKPHKLKGLDKLIVKSVRNSIRTKNFENSQLDQIALPEILPESIYRLAEKVKEIAVMESDNK